MDVLALDTATPSPAVALLVRGELFEERLPSDRRASDTLLAAIARLFSRADARLEDCGRIAVCSGPGSFTGVRVGLATAWGFSRASRTPLEAVPTLEAMAEAAPGPEGRSVVAILDAGRGEVVCQAFARDGGRARELGPARRMSPDRVGAEYSGLRRVTLTAGLVADAIPPESPVASALARAVSRAPRAEDTAAPRAVYARPSAAEEKHGAL